MNELLRLAAELADDAAADLETALHVAQLAVLVVRVVHVAAPKARELDVEAAALQVAHQRQAAADGVRRRHAELVERRVLERGAEDR